MSKKILFEPTSEDASLFIPQPIPSAECLPNWYKNMPLHLDGEEVTGLEKNGVSSSNLTIKGCMPFLDSMTAGYMFILPFDIELRMNEQGMMNIRWATNIDYLGGHGFDQAPNLPVQQGSSPNVLKWKPGWKISTPTGYSCLYLHPLNRFDLPFITMSGIVDTDSYKLGVELPFRLMDTNKKHQILEKGTPICQVVPFRRDAWDSDSVPFDSITQRQNGFLLKSKIVRSYQLQFWKRKHYR